jgi:hypothetical protein
LDTRGFNSGNLTFITLNYDILLEQAIARARGAFNYMLPGLSCNRGYAVLKVHGSINWWGSFGPFQQLRQGEPIPFDMTFTTQGPVYREMRIEQHPYEACMADDTGEPIIAHYAQGKPAYVNARMLAEIREEAIAECTAATESVIISVHPRVSPQEDETLWQLFNCLKARQVPTRYVGLCPDTDTVAKIWQFRHVPRTFRDFVQRELS